MQQIFVDEALTVLYARFNLYNLVDADKVAGYDRFNDNLPRFDLMWMKG